MGEDRTTQKAETKPYSCDVVLFRDPASKDPFGCILPSNHKEPAEGCSFPYGYFETVFRYAGVIYLHICGAARIELGRYESGQRYRMFRRVPITCVKGNISSSPRGG